MNYQNFINSKNSVLITGETGTGKTYLAKKIHNESHRKTFLQLNMGAVNSNLFESELFGHTKGAFTGAGTDKIGFCEEVGRGTLFLDEIGEISLESQAKLLTLIDEKLYYRVGSTIPKKFEGRLIFATNLDLEEKVSEGKFRKDLYYRLRFYQVELTPLRYKSDINKIIQSEIEEKVENFNKLITLSRDSLKILNEYSWPGNYRELSNTIEYLFDLNKFYITKEELPRWIKSDFLRSEKDDGSYKNMLQGFEQEYFNRLLSEAGGKIVEAVRLSGLSKPTIITKLKKYGISRLDYKNLNETKEAHGF